jgi:class 3 adenylate cyclase
MTLPVDRLSTIIQAFTEEMSLIIQAYGGYILKYIGDAILAFFTVNIIDDVYLPSVNAVNCARSMIKIVKQGINPILDQNGYPEMSVRIVNRSNRWHLLLRLPHLTIRLLLLQAAQVEWAL